MTIDTAALDLEDACDLARWAAPDLMLRSALWYAAKGWPVFPCRPGLKVPATRNGFKDATVDPSQIAAWWNAVPTYNIGLPTGIWADVIDIDGPAGYQSLADMRDEGVLDEFTVLGRAATPRGGRHIYISPTGDGNAAGVRSQIDFRGRGGFVVAPPSVGANGRRYTWLEVPA